MEALKSTGKETEDTVLCEQKDGLDDPNKYFSFLVYLI